MSSSGSVMSVYPQEIALSLVVQMFCWLSTVTNCGYLAGLHS